MGEVRVWLVERTYSDDEQNLIVLTYATPDGTREFRKERALTSFTGPSRETRVSVSAAEDDLSPVTDPDRRERFVTEIERIREGDDPDDRL